MGSKQGVESCRSSMGIRLLVTLLCITSLILLLKSKQTVQRFSGLGTVTEQVKYSDTSGFIFLVFTDILVASYGLVAFVALMPSALAKRSSGKCARWAIFVLDQILPVRVQNLPVESMWGKTEEEICSFCQTEKFQLGSNQKTRSRFVQGCIRRRRCQRMCCCRQCQLPRRCCTWLTRECPKPSGRRYAQRMAISATW